MHYLNVPNPEVLAASTLTLQEFNMTDPSQPIAAGVCWWLRHVVENSTSVFLFSTNVHIDNPLGTRCP